MGEKGVSTSARLSRVRHESCMTFAFSSSFVLTHQAYFAKFPHIALVALPHMRLSDNCSPTTAEDGQQQEEDEERHL